MNDSEEPHETPASCDDRRALLESGALALGEQWMSRTCDELREQGRRIAGGWPGTLSEARAQVVPHCAAELRRRYLPPLTSDESDLVTRCAYARARRTWLTRALRNGALLLPGHDDFEPG